MAEDNRQAKDALLRALLPDVPFDGWSRHGMIAAAKRIGLSEAETRALFRTGPRDLIAAFSRWADRQMLARLDHMDLAGMKTHERVGAAVMARIEAMALHREAVRRALAILAVPYNTPLAARLIYETVDTIWRAAGDESVDFNFYTKRGLLAGVYAATTLYWLDDRSPGAAETEAFLERRLADVMALPRLGARLREGLDRLPNPFRLMRVARKN